MSEKRKILELLLPRAVLRADNDTADRAVPDGMIREGYIPILNFPFRVGRESRGEIVEERFFARARPRPLDHRPNNDLYLLDPGPGLQVSREHFQIELHDDGYVLVDRGSSLGTMVGDLRVGAGTGISSTPLADGDTIRIGQRQSPYVYTFLCDLVPEGD